MGKKTEIQDYFTEEDCNNNPNKLYIFGDNMTYTGTGGQAIIRYCTNSYGIPTKRLPSMSDNAFFSDKQDEINKVMEHLGYLNVIYQGA